jgi:class 3 adenylate cyclase
MIHLFLQAAALFLLVALVPDTAAAWGPAGACAAALATVLGFGLISRAPAYPFEGRSVRRRPRRSASQRELVELRRYVPGPIVEQISAGARLESGERDVTVMFIDLRGYTAFAESLSPADVFAFLNLYTGTVSRIVECHGGCVVEFNGDGMMAVFGAPVALPNKEVAALCAAQEISRAVGALDRSPAGGGHRRPQRVGIGVATGPAFVGNIRAVDRVIWSAVGTTTNRASRLQALTRDLEASVVIDRATRDGAGGAPGLARHAPVSIPGLRAPVEVFTLPRDREVRSLGAARDSARPGIHAANAANRRNAMSTSHLASTLQSRRALAGAP